MRILAIGCHPDDIEMGCAGTMIKYKKAGHDVLLCHVANGDMGHMEIMPDELRKIRIQEAKDAGVLAGMEVLTCDIGDLMVNSACEEQRKKLAEIIRYSNPDVIITHSPNDYMSDHVEVSKLVFNASFAASVPHYAKQDNRMVPVTPIFYMDNVSGHCFVPTEYVDITDVMDTKLAMLEKHASQVKWIREHDGVDLAEKCEILARFRGMQCGVRYAEGFTQCQTDLRVKTYRVLP